MRFDGTLKSWNEAKGFGFIEPDQGGQDIFIHIKAFKGLRVRPDVGQRLSFEIELGLQGKKRAFNVAPLHRAARNAPPRVRREGPAGYGTASLFAIPMLLMVLWLGCWWGHPPRWALLAYPSLSVLAFVVYAMDKAAAQRGAWRTSEKTLHLLALSGGWPGALVAQQVLRHKSSKAEFRAVFWGTVVLNIAGFALLASPYGRAWQ